MECAIRGERDWFSALKVNIIMEKIHATLYGTCILNCTAAAILLLFKSRRGLQRLLSAQAQNVWGLPGFHSQYHKQQQI